MNEELLNKRLDERKRSLEESLVDGRRLVADAAAEGRDAGRLHDLVVRVAEYEARLIANKIASTGGVDELTSALLRGADDAWSGRGNDLRRSSFDAFRDEARRFVDFVRFS